MTKPQLVAFSAQWRWLYRSLGFHVSATPLNFLCGGCSERCYGYAIFVHDGETTTGRHSLLCAFRRRVTAGEDQKMLGKQRFTMAECYLLTYLGSRTAAPALRELRKSGICEYIPFDLPKFIAKLKIVTMELEVVNDATAVATRGKITNQ